MFSRKLQEDSAGGTCARRRRYYVAPRRGTDSQRARPPRCEAAPPKLERRKASRGGFLKRPGTASFFLGGWVYRAFPRRHHHHLCSRAWSVVVREDSSAPICCRCTGCHAAPFRRLLMASSNDVGSLRENPLIAPPV